MPLTVALALEQHMLAISRLAVAGGRAPDRALTRGLLGSCSKLAVSPCLCVCVRARVIRGAGFADDAACGLCRAVFCGQSDRPASRAIHL
eukprot:4394152-Alexandrium_andersonii.AAC.1